MFADLPYRKFARLGVLVGFLAFLAAGTMPIDRIVPVVAQGGSCPTVVDDALQIVGTSCAGVGLNEVCYGHTLVSATFRDQATTSPFNVAGDTAALIDLDALVTQPVNTATGDWGIALLKVQAETSTGGTQTVTMTMFGDTELSGSEAGGSVGCSLQTRTGNVNIRSGPGTGYSVIDVLGLGMTATATGRNTSGGWVRVQYQGTIGWMWESAIQTDCAVDSLPAVDATDTTGVARVMQAFTMQSGETSACDEAPNGLLIQSPSGARARIMVNGVELEFASAGFLTAQPDDSLVIVGLEGQIDVTAFGKTVSVTPGTESSVPLVGLEASGPPSDPQPVELDSNIVHLLASDITSGAVVIIERDSVNLRTGPGVNCAVAGIAYRGDQFNVIAQINEWWLIERPGQESAWIAGWIVKLEPEGAVVPMAATVPPPCAPPAFPTEPSLDMGSQFDQPSAATSEQLCTPGYWEACGTQGCGSEYSPRCNDTGTGYDCIWNPGTCGPTPVPEGSTGPSTP